jgi:tetratricopeptide (TPR) repeat protein/predicted Ser/Thr protein kinase
VLITAERYQFVRELGSGAFARVWLALDQSTNKLVAVKTLHTSMVSGSTRLRREFRALQRLEHPNIVRVFDWIEDTPPALVMEFINGLTLKDWLEQKPSFAQIVQVFAQVLEALAAVHNQGLLHRDLKPENIMVLKDNTAKLMDFGLTKSSTESLKLTREGGLVGTVLFMSPEQCRGQELDARSDLYALGAVLYLALTGQPPFVGSGLSQVLMGHIQGVLTPPRQIKPEIPIALERVVMVLLEKLPGNRPSSALLARQMLLEAFDTPSAPNRTPNSELPLAVRADALLHAPLIGRESEMTVLRAALERTGAVLLSGTAGIGKTRMLNALEANSSIGLRLLTDTCLTDDVMPFGACARFVGKLQKHQPELMQHLPDSIKLELARIAPSLAEARSLETGLEADVASLRLFEAFAGLLEVISEQVIAVFENLQWADDSTLRLLSYVVRSRPELCLILTFRPDEGQTKNLQLFKLEPSNHIQLLPLNDNAMRELLIALLGTEPEIVLEQHLLEHASGNPWILEESIKALLESGAIQERLGVFEWNRKIPSPPASLQELIEARLKNLARPSLEFAQAASILGQSFLFSDVLVLLEWQEEPALDTLEELIRAKIVLEVRSQNDEFQFQHPIFAEVLRSQVISLRRRRWHAKAAGQLEGRSNPLTLAVHYLEAGNFDAALQNAFQAGEQALERLAFPQAERAYRIALEVAQSLNLDLELNQAKFGLAQSLGALGQPIQARQLWLEIIANNHSELKTRASLELAKVLSASGDPSAIDLISEPQLEDVFYLESCLTLSLILRNNKDLERSRGFALKAYRAAIQSNHLYGIALALTQLARVAFDQNAFMPCELLVKAGLGHLEDSKYQLLNAQLYNLLGSVLQAQGHWSDAQKVFSQAARIAEQSHDLEMQARALNNTALSDVMTNQIPEALAQYQSARKLAQRAGNHSVEQIAGENIILCYYLLNQLDTASSVAQEFKSNPTAQLWNARIDLERGNLANLEIPEQSQLRPWSYGFLRLVQTEVALHNKNYQQALELTEPRLDYDTWFWALFRVHAKWKLGLDFEVDLSELQNPHTEPGLDPQFAAEYTKFVTQVLTEDARVFANHDLFVKTQTYATTVIGIFAREVLSLY